MPFTPFHMGPGLFLKGVLQGGFSVMVFGWTQILMDIQPLIVLISGEGHLHGFSHTYMGASLIAIFAGVTGKYFGEWGLSVFFKHLVRSFHIKWWVAMASAMIGSFSHVLLDALMHSDVQPFFPFRLDNPYLFWASVKALHQFCFYSGVLGVFIFLSVQAILKFRS